MRALAWRSIWRQRSRSLATAAGLAVAVFFTIADFGLVGAVRSALYTNLTDAAGHIQVHVRDYRATREFGEILIRDAVALQRRVAAAAGDGLVVGVLEVPALVSGETRARGAQVIGIDQPRALREKFTRQYLAEGRMLRPGELDGILVGAALARTLRVGVGGTVYVYAPGTEGLGAAAYTVVGLAHLPDAAVEARLAYLSLAAAQELAAPGAVTRVELRLPQYTKVSDDPKVLALRDRVAAALGSRYTVESWRDFNPALARVNDVLTPYLLVFTAVIFVLAGLMVVNTVYLSLMERIREFGVILALGAGRRTVMGMVLWESLLLCASGAAVGSLLGLALVWYLGGGFSLPAVMQEVGRAFGYPQVLYASLQPSEVLVTAAFVVATGVLAALWPARVAAALQPVEAMRFVP